jgi:hypothetical protein
MMKIITIAGFAEIARPIIHRDLRKSDWIPHQKRKQQPIPPHHGCHLRHRTGLSEQYLLSWLLAVTVKPTRFQGLTASSYSSKNWWKQVFPTLPFAPNSRVTDSTRVLAMCPQKMITFHRRLFALTHSLEQDFMEICDFGVDASIEPAVRAVAA